MLTSVPVITKVLPASGSLEVSMGFGLSTLICLSKASSIFLLPLPLSQSTTDLETMGPTPCIFSSFSAVAFLKLKIENSSPGDMPFPRRPAEWRVRLKIEQVLLFLLSQLISKDYQPISRRNAEAPEGRRV